MLFDIDSTLLDTYGNQEGEGFNYHYQAHGYHPLLCYDGLTGDLLKAELRDGTMYCSKEADIFMKSLLDEFLCDFPDLPLYFRGDSGFASPDLYEVLEDKTATMPSGSRRTQNSVNWQKRKTGQQDSTRWITRWSMGNSCIRPVHGAILAEWFLKSRNPYGQMIHLYTFVVTTLEMEPYQVIRFYCGRGKMENFIKEGKSGFDFASVSNSSKLVNANRLLIHALAYNLFNWFRRLALASNMRKQRIDTIRLKLLKIAARVVKSARYKCSSCPYKKEFYETLENIRNLRPQLE